MANLTAQQKELRAKDNYLFALACIVIILGGAGYNLARAGWVLLGAVLGILALAVGFYGYTLVRSIYEKRARIIRYKENVDDLFVHSIYPEDDQVQAMRKEALDGLYEARVPNVRVYTVIYRHVVYTYHWWEETQEGELVLKRKEVTRKGLPVAETWHQFIKFVTTLKAETLNTRRLELTRLNDQDTLEQTLFNQI